MSSKKLFIFVSLILVLVIVPLLIFNSNNGQDVITKETTPSPSRYEQGNNINQQQSDKGEVKETVTIRIVGPDINIQGSVAFEEGDTIVASLLKAKEQYNFSVDLSGSGAMTYVHGIAGVYEFDYGPTSGWLAYLNGEAIVKSSGTVSIKENDVIEWKYSEERS